MSCWSHIIIEGYCLYNSLSKKTHKFHSLNDVNDLCKPVKKDEWEKRENKYYIPRSKRPTWCKKENKKFVPNFKCLGEGDKCPFFAYTNCDKKEYDMFFEVWVANGVDKE